MRVSETTGQPFKKRTGRARSEPDRLVRSTTRDLPIRSGGHRGCVEFVNASRQRASRLVSHGAALGEFEVRLRGRRVERDRLTRASAYVIEASSTTEHRGLRRRDSPPVRVGPCRLRCQKTSETAPFSGFSLVASREIDARDLCVRRVPFGSERARMKRRRISRWRTLFQPLDLKVFANTADGQVPHFQAFGQESGRSRMDSGLLFVRVEPRP